MRTQPVARGRRRSERSRRAILDGAAKLLTERGYADITIEGVAAEAGVGKTTIYRWWSTKAAIYIDVYSELAAQVVPPPDTGNVETDLRLLIQGAFKLYRETAAGLALAGIVAEAQSNEAVSRIVRTQFVPSRRQVTLAILNRAAKRGEIPSNLNLGVISELITAGVWFHMLVGDGALPAHRAKQLLKTIMAGIPAKSLTSNGSGPNAEHALRGRKARSTSTPSLRSGSRSALGATSRSTKA